MYPELTVEQTHDPNRLWAIPIVGGMIKGIILIPVFIVATVLIFIYAIMCILNAFMVLFTGTYWQTAYNFILGMVRWLTKVWYYWFGVTNKYPGFDFATGDEFSLDMEMPDGPNRVFAIPILGVAIRYILTIPYIIWLVIVEYAAITGALASTIPVLFTGRYPESIHEIVRDFTRVYAAYMLYYSGFTEQYPSFAISWNHKAIKITLIAIGVLWLLIGVVSNIQTATSGTRR